MSVLDNLDALRRVLPGCSVVALGDLTAQLVLCASHSGQMPQERLDRLCTTAASLLEGAEGADTASILGASKGSGLEVASVLSGLETQIFVRSQVDPSDVLCCVCGRNVDITEAADLARSTLAEISAQH